MLEGASLFVRLWFHMWRLFCHCLFLISPSVGASGGLCFVIVEFLIPSLIFFHFYYTQNKNMQSNIYQYHSKKEQPSQGTKKGEIKNK